jgi:hypothetical protein
LNFSFSNEINDIDDSLGFTVEGSGLGGFMTPPNP